MVDCAQISLDRPLQRSARHGSRKGEAIINSGLNLRSFFVVVPSHELQCGQLFPRVVEVVDFRKCLQPGLAALLSHDPARTPGRQGIVESFVGSTHGLFFRVRHSGVIEARQIALPVIVGGRHHPGIAAVAERVTESAAILKKEHRLGGQRGVHSGPIHGIGIVNGEVCDDGPTLLPHVSRRREIGLLNILQLADQRLLG